MSVCGFLVAVTARGDPKQRSWRRGAAEKPASGGSVTVVAQRGLTAGSGRLRQRACYLARADSSCTSTHDAVTEIKKHCTCQPGLEHGTEINAALRLFLRWRRFRLLFIFIGLQALFWGVFGFFFFSKRTDRAGKHGEFTFGIGTGARRAKRVCAKPLHLRLGGSSAFCNESVRTEIVDARMQGVKESSRRPRSTAPTPGGRWGQVGGGGIE